MDRETEGCYSLWRAVLIQAIIDAKYRQVKIDQQVYYSYNKQARDWILEDENFEVVCKLLELDPIKIRNNINKVPMDLHDYPILIEEDENAKATNRKMCNLWP